MASDRNLTSSPSNEAIVAEDLRLVQGCMDGDQESWNRLIEKYKRLIYSIPTRYGLPPEDAGDIFQNVCVDLYTNLSKLRKVESLRSWLITVTTHKCFHWNRKGRQEVELDAMEQEAAEEIAPVLEMVQEVEQEQIVRDAIELLPDRCAALIKMLFYEHPPVPYNEVAGRLGLATGSIGFIRGRCLNRLKKILKELGF